MGFFSTADDWLNAPVPGPRRRPRAGGRGGRNVSLAPLLIGGTVAVVALCGRSKIGSWLRGFLTAGDLRTRDELRGRLQSRELALPALREKVLGKRKAEIASTFGPPRTAVMTGRGAAPNSSAISQAAFWRADTWYYAINPRTQTAMAVKFDADTAVEVDFFDAPQPEMPKA